MSSSFSGSSVLPVLLPLPLDEPFDYLAPEARALAPGSFVIVPFGARETVGVVWDWPARRRAPPERLKRISRALDAPPMPAILRAFLGELAKATLTPLGAALRLAMSVPAALEPQPPKLAYALPATAPREPAGAAETRVVAALVAAGGPVLATDLAKTARTSAAILRRMAAAGLVSPVAMQPDLDPTAPRPDLPPVPLSADQQAAAARLCQLVDAGAGVALLDGVPGAGKTEVYFEAVAAALRNQRRVLVLLPEIALSTQWLERFERRFGAAPVAWHSGLTTVQRRRRWQMIAAGRAPVVVGARSALFLPHTGLGLIVVDEEHDPSFKQEDGAIYSARDLALVRARLEGCAIVLATATPSLETALAAGGIDGGPPAAPGWRRVVLPARHSVATPPVLELVDLKRERPPPGAFLSPRLREALAATVDSGAQALMFLNRRGFAPLTLCRACGHRLRCPNCAAWLTAHRLRRRLLCHHCGYAQPEPEHCPHCGALDALAVSGPGVERVAEEVRTLLPRARAAVMTSDTVGTATAAEALVHAMAAHEIDVLIGTQMVAKGHHFPDLLLVGVVDADLALTGGDLRAAERTFQLLYQVAGRAGRELRPGRVLVQTHLPGHPVMQALVAGDRDRFLAVELEERREAGMPPFGRLAALILAGPEVERVKQAGRALALAAPEEPGITILGPAPAPLALLRGRWRERLLVKATDDVELPGYLRRWLGSHRLPGKVDLTVDVDPQSFF